MFSLRDSSSVCSSGTDEDSFGWWIGIDAHSQTTESSKESSLQPPSISSGCSASCSGSSDEASSNGGRERSNEPSEHIELCSFTDSADDEDEDRPLCYTPERLIRTEDYRILAPSPRIYPTLDDLISNGIQRKVPHRTCRKSDEIDENEKRIGATHLAALLRTPLRNSASSKSSVDRCCCIRYSDGEVLLHNESCSKYGVKESSPNVELIACIHPRFDSEYAECNVNCKKSDERLTSTKETAGLRDLGDDTSGVSSVDAVSGTRGDDWSSIAEEDEEDEEENDDDGLPPRRLSDELSYVSFEYTLMAPEKQYAKMPSVSELESILTNLHNPKRVEALLLDEDKFRDTAQYRHESLARLALAIEPNDKFPAASTRRNYPEFELEQLRDKVERLHDSNKDLHEEITSLRKDFMKDEWKVSHLSEDINKLRNEVYELRYLDDLLKLLKGEIERISNRNWPFIIGHTKNGTEELNLVV